MLVPSPPSCLTHRASPKEENTTSTTLGTGEHFIIDIIDYVVYDFMEYQGPMDRSRAYAFHILHTYVYIAHTCKN